MVTYLTMEAWRISRGPGIQLGIEATTEYGLAASQPRRRDQKRCSELQPENFDFIAIVKINDRCNLLQVYSSYNKSFIVAFKASQGLLRVQVLCTLDVSSQNLLYPFLKIFFFWT